MKIVIENKDGSNNASCAIYYKNKLSSWEKLSEKQKNEFLNLLNSFSDLYSKFLNK